MVNMVKKILNKLSTLGDNYYNNMMRGCPEPTRKNKPKV